MTYLFSKLHPYPNWVFAISSALHLGITQTLALKYPYYKKFLTQIPKLSHFYLFNLCTSKILTINTLHMQYPNTHLYSLLLSHEKMNKTIRANELSKYECILIMIIYMVLDIKCIFWLLNKP